MTRPQAKARTRELLLEAAAREVTRRGVAASVRDIAETAGFSQGALYANFADKESILLELLQRHMAEAASGMAALLAGTSDGASAWRALETWAADEPAGIDWAVIAIELQLHARRTPSFAEAYEAAMADSVQAWGQIVQELFDRSGATPPISPAWIAKGLMAMANGLALDRSKDAAGMQPGQLALLCLKALIQSSTPPGVKGRKP